MLTVNRQLQGGLGRNTKKNKLLVSRLFTVWRTVLSSERFEVLRTTENHRSKSEEEEEKNLKDADYLVIFIYLHHCMITNFFFSNALLL